MKQVFVVLSSLVFLFSLCSSATFSVASKDNPDIREMKALPFTIRRNLLPDSLGIEVEIDWDAPVRLLGMKSIYFGLRFPPCTSRFEAYIDLRAWNLLKLSRFINIDIPKICANDFGLSIPYSQLCVSVKDISIMKDSIVASIYADMTVGASFFQLREDSILLADFSIGRTSKCILQKTLQTCVTNGCGWCAETQKCLETRSDNRADTCLFCNRCQYYTTNDMKSECMRKMACGWCEADKTCYAGDNLGPFNRSSACIPASFPSKSEISTQVAEIAQQPATQWNFNEPVPADQAAGQIALGVFLSLVIGFIIGASVLSIIILIPLCVYCARAKVSPFKYFKTIFVKPQPTSSLKDKKEKLLQHL